MERQKELWEGLLSPGQVIRPEVSIELAKELVLEHFGLHVKKITELVSYDDKNFLVEIDPSSQGRKRRFVFKVLNSMDSRKGHVSAENAAMLFLHSRGIICPVPQPSLQGSTHPLVQVQSERDEDNKNNGKDSVGKFHVIRLLSFVEGRILHSINVTEKLLFNVGIYVAQILNNFDSFENQALENHRSVWTLCSTPYLKRFIYVLESDKNKYELVSSVLEAFENRVIPVYPKLQKGVIHGDLNEQNLIVDEMNGIWNVAGVIDFGDMQKNYLVFELAIIMAYMMLECTKTEIDPLEGSAFVLEGFVTKRYVPQIELEILRTCIAGRLCQSLVLGLYTHTLDPMNDYLLTTSHKGWNLLHRIWNHTTDTQLLSIFKKKIPNLINE